MYNHKTFSFGKGWSRFLVIACLFAFFAYARTLGFDLVWDDLWLARFVGESAAEKGPLSLLAAKFVLDPSAPTDYYRPVVLLSFFLDDKLSGVFPFIYHLTNVLLHTANTALTFLFISLVTKSRKAGFFGALVFAVHPVHTESVAFASGRTDLWATVFVLVATVLWLKKPNPTGNRRIHITLGGLVICGLAFLSKEVAYAMPFVLLAWSVVGTGKNTRGGWWRGNRYWLSIWTIAVIGTITLRWLAVGLEFGPPELAVNQTEGFNLVPGLWTNYFRLLLFPWPLNAYYTNSQTILTPWSMAASVILIGLCFEFSRRRHHQVGLLSLLWVVGFIVPVGGFVPLRGGAPLAERFLYLPSIGLSLLLGYLADRLAGLEKFKTFVYAGTAGLVSVFLMITVARSAVWKNEATLFTNLAKTSPSSWVVSYNLGRVYSDQNSHERAIQAFKKTIRLNPDFPRAYHSLGIEQGQAGRLEEAIAALEQATMMEPGNAMFFYNLGNAYALSGKYEEAIESYDAAIRINPKQR